MDRRQLLTASTLGLAGLAGGSLSAAPAATGNTGGRARSTIMIWLNGGPSHVDLWDMKPDAPAEIRGPFQPVSRDFAFVMDRGIAAAAILKAARGADKALIKDVGIFDVFEGNHVGEGKKSVAIEVTLQPKDKTLTDEEIDKVSAAVVAAVTKTTGGELRK